MGKRSQQQPPLDKESEQEDFGGSPREGEAGGEGGGKCATSLGGSASVEPSADAEAETVRRPLTGRDLEHEIERLKEEQKKQRSERAKTLVQLRNAKRRKTRLKNKAKLLSNDDLVAVLQLRGLPAATLEGKQESSASTNTTSAVPASGSTPPPHVLA